MLKPLALMGLLLAIGFTTQKALAQTPVTASDEDDTTTYHLAVGDSLEILYRSTPEYNQTVTLLPDGDVTLQLLGNVHLAGLTLKQAHEKVTELAAKRLRNPELSLVVKDLDKDHFVVLGEVTTPGRYELHGHITAVEALALAGGFKQTSSQSNVYLLHKTGDVYSDAVVIDYRKLRQKNTSTEMPAIQSGDVLVVTTSKFARFERIVKLGGVGLYYPLP